MALGQVSEFALQKVGGRASIQALGFPQRTLPLPSSILSR